MFRVTEDDREPREVAADVYLSDLAAGERASMKFWRVEPGATLPTHRHSNEQIGYVISGTLTALVEGEEHTLEPGDSYAFPSGELHGAENRGDEPAVGIGVLSPPRRSRRRARPRTRGGRRGARRPRGRTRAGC
ncbi:cupin domain-containing protein [Halobacteriales archaeon QS_5_70_17]|nr:MAG: cupin domain-containing protein [Halobacteriales archaeon QS_5_70_17]